MAVQSRHFFRFCGDYLGVADAVKLHKIQPFAKPAAVGLFRQAAVACQVGVIGPVSKTQQAGQQHTKNFFCGLDRVDIFSKIVSSSGMGTLVLETVGCQKLH